MRKQLRDTQTLSPQEKEKLLFALWECPISKDSFADITFPVDVRKFSSWTLSPKAAYMLSTEGGQYQIGEGAVVVRAAPKDMKIVHTVAAGQAFEKFARKHVELDKVCPAFIQPWIWQKEYVVYAPGLEVEADGAAVVSDDDSKYYRRVMRAVD